MLDLAAMTRKFVDRAVEIQLRDLAELDAKAIEAIDDKDGSDRGSRLQEWLYQYGAWQGYKEQNRREVVAKIVEFADERDRGADLRSLPKLMETYTKLFNLVSSAAPRKKNGKLRDVTSLTSKALWCCYPDAVPIYDGNVQYSLWIISRLLDATPRPDLPPYGQFAEVWFRMYEQVASVIDEADLRGYPYKLRVFDKILWIVGQPSFSRG